MFMSKKTNFSDVLHLIVDETCLINVSQMDNSEKFSYPFEVESESGYVFRFG